MESEERLRKNSIQDLLYDLYEGIQSPSHYGIDTESWTDSTNSIFSETSPLRKGKHNAESLRLMTIAELSSLQRDLHRESTEQSQRLVKELKRRDHQLSRAQAKCNLLTATLQALSPKRSVDTKLQFSLEPPSTDCGYEQWLNAMRAVARLPDGIPHHFRKKLWLTLAQHHIQQLGIDWPQVCITCFNDRMNPDDDKLGMQIIKDLHRTGWSGLSGDHERIYLKRVLLAYARYNKTIGYCQGLNVIAALVLDVLEFREENALKVMIYLLEQVLPCGYFDQTLRALSVDMAVLRDLMQSRLPRLATHLDDLQKSSESEYEPPLPNVFSMQWFLTLFATCLPRNAVFRVWDSLMLEGSEVLLRTALAIWAKIARRVHRSNSADQFYGLMGGLCAELLQMSPSESNDLLQVIYTMAEFPYPGLSELREKYTWNIQPFSSTFRVLSQQVKSILHSDSDDNESDYKSPQCMSLIPDGGCGSGRVSSPTDLGSLQKQYKLIKQRQKQASVILQNAYERGQQRINTRAKPILSPQAEIFNHLYVGKSSASSTYSTLNGNIPMSSKTVQPSGKARSSIETLAQRSSPDSPEKWMKNRTERYDSSSISTTTPDISTLERRSRCNTMEFVNDLSSDGSTPRASSPIGSLLYLGMDLGRTCPRRCHSSLDMSGPVPLQSCGKQCHWKQNDQLKLEKRSKSSEDIDTVILENKFVSRKISVAESESLFRTMSAQKGKCILEEQRRTERLRSTESNDSQTTISDRPVVRRKPKGTILMDRSKAILNSMGMQDNKATDYKNFNPFPTRHTSKLIEKERKMGLY